MTSSVPLSPVPTGSSSQTRLPFTGLGPMVVRQETVLSAPRGNEAEALSPPADSTSPSHVSRRLFPGQVQPVDLDDVIGTTLDHFVIESRIGAGGMGTVFLARDERLQRRVALKVMSPQQTADPAAVQRFQNEARSAARLDHDHVARVFFTGDDHGLQYIAYEFVEGANLRDLIRQQVRLDPAIVVNYAVQLATALCHTSANGVVHRDIKPSNIIITPLGKAKLVDLGLARKESLEESAQLTVAGTTLGTFDYISPEQAKDPRNVDVRSDIYSLGCTLYHALTGEPPFPDGTVLQRLLDHQDKPPPDPCVKNRRVSPALSAVVRKMMAADPKHRYPSAEDLLRDLLVISQAMGLQALPADSAIMSAWRSAERRDWSQHALWLVTAAALFLVATLLQAFPDTVARWTGTPTAADNTLVESPRELGPTSSGTFHDLNETPVRNSDSTGSPSVEIVGTEDTRGTMVAIPLLPDGSSSPEMGPLKRGPFEDALPPLTTPNLFTLRDDAGPESFAEASGLKPPATEVRTNPPATAADVRPPPLPVAGESVAADAAAVLPYLVVGSGKAYSSLEAACADLKDRDVIELDYDGRLSTAERPLRLINKRVEIRAAKGRRPVLWFAPRDVIADAFQTRMISVTGGTLTLANVAIEFKVPETSSADLWAVFRLARPERFRLDRTSITILNPGHMAATVVEVAAPDTEAFSKMGAMKDGQSQVPSEIFIEDSVIRGDAAGIRIRDVGSVHLDCKQSLFALGEWLVQAEQDVPTANSSLRLTADLAHTTCLLGQGLLRSVESDGLSGRTSPIEIRARNNLFAVGPSAALIEQRFPLSAMDPQRSLIWVGERNFYDSIGQFWLVQTPGPLGEQRWDYRAWCGVWSGEANGSQNDAVVWKSPWRLKEWAKITADDVHLDPDSESNPAVGAIDGHNAGVDPLQLPAERTATVIR